MAERPPESADTFSSYLPYTSAEEKDHLAAVGSVAVEWAFLELKIDTKALDLAKIDPELGACFTAQVIGPGRKIDAYIAVARFLGSTKLNSRLQKFAKDTTGLAERRNRVVHDPWLVDRHRVPARLEITAKQTLRRVVVAVPTREVITLSEQIAQHLVKFLELHEAVVIEMGRSMEKPPSASPLGRHR